MRRLDDSAWRLRFFGGADDSLSNERLVSPTCHEELDSSSALDADEEVKWIGEPVDTCRGVVAVEAVGAGAEAEAEPVADCRA